MKYNKLISKVKKNQNTDDLLTLIKIIFTIFMSNQHNYNWIKNFDEDLVKLENSLSYLYLLTLRIVTKYHYLNNKEIFSSIMTSYRNYFLNYINKINSSKYRINIICSNYKNEFNEWSIKRHINDEHIDKNTEINFIDKYKFEQILEIINPMQRNILNLKIKGYTFKEISKILNIKNKVAINQFYQIRNNIKAHKIYYDIV